MSKHTPGPWKQHLVDETLIVGRDGGHIATASGDYDIEYKAMEANARLIAAAPELLEALKALVHYYSDGKPARFAEHKTHPISHAIAAIAKAEGR